MLVAEKQQTIMIFSNTSFVIKKRLIFFCDFSFLVITGSSGTSAKQQTESWYEGNKTYYEGKPVYSGATGPVSYTHLTLPTILLV